MVYWTGTMRQAEQERLCLMVSETELAHREQALCGDAEGDAEQS